MSAPCSIDTLTFTHPKRSSDYCLEVAGSDPARPARVVAVCDMIGRPWVIQWLNYVRRMQRDLQHAVDEGRPASLDDLSAIVRRVLRHHNELVRAVRTRHDRTAFGFCLVLAAIYADEARIYWLGDCRAYSIRAGEARCLTRDQNRLQVAVAASGEEPLVLFMSEIMELSRHLDGFLGMYGEPEMDALLDAQDARVRFDGETGLMLVTDGLYMPLVRERMDATNHRLTEADLYAESTLAAIMAAADREPAGSMSERWMHRAERAVSTAVSIGRRRPRYRDDIAMILLHPAD